MTREERAWASACDRFAERERRLQEVLREIRDLDPELTQDGYTRGPDSRYEDDVYAIAEAALEAIESGL